ncbi:cilia- and flagella-associated protein 99-like isoform X3 [Entelurus aequoreus]|uniref:cilia- and flagella-associated protein 99-like isoform X3 n=1 Tax=Entelurus aequoreus TaxID=161455 RepID=UPI002B1D56E1|nr:cilia- and flagella-associated protein 99-like isoform X3 [Entelurus aequoreus]
MAKNYGSLVKEAIVLLDKYTASKHTTEDFTEDATKNLQGLEAKDKEFLIVVVSGCIEHKKLLDIVIDPFYAHNPKHIPKQHRSQLTVICSLTIFHLDDLGLQVYSNIVSCLDFRSMHTFLSFFFEHLTTWIQDEWTCMYNAEYVMAHWIDPLLRRSKIETLLEKLEARERGERASPKTTEPVEFSFSKRKPHSPPQPTLSPPPEKHRAVPNSTYKIGKDVQILEENKQRNHQIMEDLLHEATTTSFRCANPKKSDHPEKVISRIKEELDSKLKFNSEHRCQPSPVKKKWPVKLNSATILRQRALYDRKVEEELQRLETLAKGAHESSSFHQWQKEMREKDQQERLAKIDQKHAEILLGQYEKFISRTKAVELKKKSARLKKEEASELTLQRVQRRLQEVNEKRDLVQQVSENCKKNPKEAKEMMMKFKQSVAKDITGHSQTLLLQAQEEARAELNRKFHTISELHTIEYVPLITFKYFDDTEHAGHELLEEMSHVELKERLFFIKEAEMNEQQKKRECILEEKQKKKQLLLDVEDTISLHNKAREAATTIRKEEEKEVKLRLQQTREETFSALRKKCEEVKLRCHKLKQSQLNKTKCSKQKISWEDMEQRLEQYVERKDPQIVSQKGKFKK